MGLVEEVGMGLGLGSKWALPLAVRYLDPTVLTVAHSNGPCAAAVAMTVTGYNLSINCGIPRALDGAFATNKTPCTGTLSGERVAFAMAIAHFSRLVRWTHTSASRPEVSPSTAAYRSLIPLMPVAPTVHALILLIPLAQPLTTADALGDFPRARYSWTLLHFVFGWRRGVGL